MVLPGFGGFLWGWYNIDFRVFGWGVVGIRFCGVVGVAVRV